MSETPENLVGDILREWRGRRGLSQLALSLDAGVSQRHLSFVESGRSRPSRDMLIRFAASLSMPLRAQNTLLIAGGFAPAYPERHPDDPAFRAARQMVETILRRHEPFPALAVDRHWNMIFANAGAGQIMQAADPSLLASPVNVLRAALHPNGIAPIIRNFGEWRAHLLHRLSAQIEASGDPVLERLEAELRAYPIPPGVSAGTCGVDLGGIAVPLQITLDGAEMSFISTTTVFGTATDITLSELVVETFFPADDQTHDLLMQGYSHSIVPGGFDVMS
ncbi:helix-turn-helix transcriptional regulator [Paracoccus aurantiacus]|uniref:Helix-turn-helix transcriptional regulator n=1 Tax=Paracoccus aurantiacus TaxID=2599412 RepID=A0A5C6S312_9RHOB|nr:helix-turn-helix transcriptional regulator [Paracoccus aurantiacus]TXB68646.1 helix-turn-helix transcriptional regulator [Paracoccus aurantiacus]